MELADIDLLDRDRFTQGIPHEWFTHLRANAPVYKHPEPDGPGFWVISKHADVITCNRDAASFSSQAARGGVVGLEERVGAQSEAEARRRQPHALHGPAGPHPVPQAREPRLHPPDDRPARTAHP